MAFDCGSSRLKRALEDVGTLLGLLQVVACATDGDLMAMLDEVLDAFLQGEELRAQLAVGSGYGHECDVVD